VHGSTENTGVENRGGSKIGGGKRRSALNSREKIAARVENESGRIMESRTAAVGASSESAMTRRPIGAKSSISSSTFRNIASYSGLVLCDMTERYCNKWNVYSKTQIGMKIKC